MGTVVRFWRNWRRRRMSSRRIAQWLRNCITQLVSCPKSILNIWLDILYYITNYCLTYIFLFIHIWFIISRMIVSVDEYIKSLVFHNIESCQVDAALRWQVRGVLQSEWFPICEWEDVGLLVLWIYVGLWPL